MRPLFHSSLQDNLGKLARNEYASDEERDELLHAVFEAQNIKPRDVVWMAYRPEKFLRDGAVRVLRRIRTLDTINQFVVESKDKSESALRSATEILFGLRIPGIENHLSALLGAEEEPVRDATRRLIFEAPVTPALSQLFWNLAESPNTGNRSAFLDRLATLELADDDVPRWVKQVHDDDPMVRATALRFLSVQRTVECVDLIVENLPRVDYATQQNLITALSGVAPAAGTGFCRQPPAAHGLGRSGYPFRGDQNFSQPRESPRTGQEVPQVLERPRGLGERPRSGLDEGVRGRPHRTHHRAPLGRRRRSAGDGAGRRRLIRRPADHPGDDHAAQG